MNALGHFQLKQLQYEIEKRLRTTYEEKPSTLRANLIDALSTYLGNIKDVKSHSVGPIRRTWFVSYVIEPTRHKRRRGRRFFVFTDNRGTEHRMRRYIRFPEDAKAWAESQLGEARCWIEFTLNVTPVATVQTIHIKAKNNA